MENGVGNKERKIEEERGEIKGKIPGNKGKNKFKNPQIKVGISTRSSGLSRRVKGRRCRDRREFLVAGMSRNSPNSRDCRGWGRDYFPRAEG